MGLISHSNNDVCLVDNSLAWMFGQILNAYSEQSYVLLFLGLQWFKSLGKVLRLN